MTDFIDYLLCYDGEAARAAAFPPPEEEQGNPLPLPSWRLDDRDVMPITVTIAPAIYGEPDENGIAPIVTPAVMAPGVWIAVRTNGRDAEIEAMPECLLASDTALAAAGERYVIFCRLQPTTILGQVSPVFAGDAYSIPVGEPASALDPWLIGEAA